MPPQSKRLVSCPSDELLISYGRKELSSEQEQAVSSHLLFCDICLEYLKLLSPGDTQDVRPNSGALPELDQETTLDSSLVETIERFRTRQKQRHVEPRTRERFEQDGGKFQVGQIWRPRSKAIVVPSLDDDDVFSVTDLDSRPHLIVITNATVLEEELGDAKYHVVRVAPLDADLDCVKDDDLLIPEGDSPLGYSFLIQAWNEQVMLVENLECLLAELNATEHRAILERLNGIGESELADGAFSLEAIIMKGHYPDPVMRYRAREYEDTAYLRTPVESLRSSRVAESSFDDLPEYSDRQDEKPATQQIAEGPDFISTILRASGISDVVWAGGWRPEAARAADGGRSSQLFYNADKSLSATVKPTGKRMLLRIESEDVKWEGALVPFIWKQFPDDDAEYKCVFAILSKDEERRGSYAEIKLGDVGEIAYRELPETPYALESLGKEMSDVVRDSIQRALTNHELDAWYELAERPGLDPDISAAIKEELQR